MRVVGRFVEARNENHYPACRMSQGHSQSTTAPCPSTRMRMPRTRPKRDGR
jgi:hypothetical protein